MWDVHQSAIIAEYKGQHGHLLSCQWSLLDPDLVYSGSDDFSLHWWVFNPVSIEMCVSSRNGCGTYFCMTSTTSLCRDSCGNKELIFLLLLELFYYWGLLETDILSVYHVMRDVTVSVVVTTRFYLQRLNELLGNITKTFILVIWSLAGLYFTHPNQLLLQPVYFALTYSSYTFIL